VVQGSMVTHHNGGTWSTIASQVLKDGFLLIGVVCVLRGTNASSR
jgi:hypothetical protein